MSAKRPICMPLLLFHFPSSKLFTNIYPPAPPCNNPKPISPRLPNELYLPPHLTLQQLPNNNNDHPPNITQDFKPNLQPSRLSPRPRLGVPSSSHHLRSSTFHNWFSAPGSYAFFPRDFTFEFEYECYKQYLCNDKWGGEIGGGGYGGGEVL